VQLKPPPVRYAVVTAMTTVHDVAAYIERELGTQPEVKLPPEDEVDSLFDVDSVDGEAATRWLEGAGVDPWNE